MFPSADNPRCVCMVGEGDERRCSKNFPKDHERRTIHVEDQYPRYRRRSPEDGGFIHQLKKVVEGTERNVVMDNRHVVPYNPALLAKFKAHLNVESVFNLQARIDFCKVAMACHVLNVAFSSPFPGTKVSGQVPHQGTRSPDLYPPGDKGGPRCWRGSRLGRGAAFISRKKFG